MTYSPGPSLMRSDQVFGDWSPSSWRRVRAPDSPSALSHTSAHSRLSGWGSMVVRIVTVMGPNALPGLAVTLTTSSDTPATVAAITNMAVIIDVRIQK